MRYKSLNDLINESSSSRKFFLSLPADMQSQLRKLNDCIHSASDLHITASKITGNGKAINLSNSLDRYFH